MSDTTYTRVTPDLLEKLWNVVSEGSVIVDRASMDRYGRDETEDLLFTPEVVVKAASVIDVSMVAAFCTAHNIPLTARGAGTGLSGGALPVKGGIIVSLEKMNRIIDIDERNLQA